MNLLSIRSNAPSNICKPNYTILWDRMGYELIKMLSFIIDSSAMECSRRSLGAAKMKTDQLLITCTNVMNALGCSLLGVTCVRRSCGKRDVSSC
jgi:hypothetical protein